MAEITAGMVKQLRETTNVSMMECKRALVEADGDMKSAERILRERGMALAVKKAARTANQGLVASATAADGYVSLIEVNCETDFVARNDAFKAFVAELAAKACATDKLKDDIEQARLAKVQEIGENIVVRRATRFAPIANGKTGSYIHLGGKVGVLVELGCGKAATAGSEAFVELIKDLTLHIAACSPRYLTERDVPADVIASERAIYAKQVEGKPAQIVEKIVDGKMKKFYSDFCFVDQEFVKEQKKPIRDLLAEKGKAMGDTLEIKRFVRYQLGEQ